jgi:mono/diheme cytochrome c family protein
MGNPIRHSRIPRIKEKFQRHEVSKDLLRRPGGVVMKSGFTGPVVADLLTLGLALGVVFETGVLHAAVDSWTPPAQDAARQNPVVVNANSIAQGKGIYEKECLSCHGAGGKGDGRKADTLEVKPSDLSKPRVSAQPDGVLFWKISEGKTPMPSFRSKLASQELWAVINYVRTLGSRNAGAGESPDSPIQGKPPALDQGKTEAVAKTPEAQHVSTNFHGSKRTWSIPARAVIKRNPLAPTEGSLEEGKQLYQQECASCHGPNGKGDGHKSQLLDVSPADLTSPKMWEETDGELAWKIKQGNMPMPSFRLRFSSHEVWLLVNHLRTLGSQGAQVQSPRHGESQPSGRASEAPNATPDRLEAGAGRSGSEASPELEPAKSKNRAGVDHDNRRGDVLQPEYLHVLINPVPLYGIAGAVFMLTGALILRNRPAQLLALGLMVLSAASAWPAYSLGQKAYTRVYSLADAQGQKSLDSHKHRAERLIYAYYALAVIGLAATLVPAKAPKTTFLLALLTLLVALGSLGIGGWIAKAGGQIRHSEFRTGTSQ